MFRSLPLRSYATRHSLRRSAYTPDQQVGNGYNAAYQMPPAYQSSPPPPSPLPVQMPPTGPYAGPQSPQPPGWAPDPYTAPSPAPAPAAQDADAGFYLARSELVRKDVIARTSGARLGAIVDLWVDTARWEVMALDLKPPIDAIVETVTRSLNPDGTYGAIVLLSSLRQVGDVALVHDEGAIERGFSPLSLSTLIALEVVSEGSGEQLGKVRDFTFDPESGRIVSVIYDRIGSPLLPRQTFNLYSVAVSDITAAGPTRIIVREAAARRLLSRGLVDGFLLPSEEFMDYGPATTTAPYPPAQGWDQYAYPPPPAPTASTSAAYDPRGWYDYPQAPPGQATSGYAAAPYPPQQAPQQAGYGRAPAGGYPVPPQQQQQPAPPPPVPRQQQQQAPPPPQQQRQALGLPPPSSIPAPTAANYEGFWRETAPQPAMSNSSVGGSGSYDGDQGSSGPGDGARPFDDFLDRRDGVPAERPMQARGAAGRVWEQQEQGQYM